MRRRTAPRGFTSRRRDLKRLARDAGHLADNPNRAKRGAANLVTTEAEIGRRELFGADGRTWNRAPLDQTLHVHAPLIGARRRPLKTALDYRI